MRCNLLKQNDEKTEVVLLGTNKQLAKLPLLDVHIGDANIQPSHSARNIGVIFDSQLNMAQHITATCKAANYHIWNISRIRRYLTKEATETLVHAFISSKLDYGNGLLAGLPKYQIKKLQRVQNAAARLVVRAKKSVPSEPILQSLHWLPVQERIRFKVLLTTFKSLHGKAPQYIRDLLTVYQPERFVRSQDMMRLVEPRRELETFGARSFSAMAPKFWNQLPMEVKMCETVDVFKRRLKTHLFKHAYDT